MFGLILSWLLVAVALTSGCIQTSLRAEVVCHLQADLDPTLIDPCKCTILVVKGVSIGNESNVAADIDLSFAGGFRDKNPHLKIVSSFAFKNLRVFTNPQSISDFSGQISSFVETNGLDGVEIDFTDAELIKNSDDVTSVMKVIRLSLDQRIHKISKRGVPMDKSIRGHKKYRRKRIQKDSSIDNSNGTSFRGRGNRRFQDYFDKRNLQSTGQQITPAKPQPGWTIPDKVADPTERVLRPLEERIGNGKLLMLTLPSKPRQLVKGYDIKELSRIVDLFGVASHNLTASSHSSTTYHHSRLMGVSDLENADSLLDLVVSMGVPPDRLVMGVSTFAGLFTLKNANENVPGSATVNNPRWISYAEVCKLLSEGNWTIERDDDLTAPFAFRNRSWIAFDDPTSIKIKSKYALLRGLAGIGIYNLENDDVTGACDQDRFPLLESVSLTFTQLSRRPRSAILQSLVHDLDVSATNGRSSFAESTNIKSSPFRIVRVVDRTGSIRSIRSDSNTKHECSRQGYYRDPDDCLLFYRCVKFDQYVDDFTVFEYTCPVGLVFDDRWEVCAWPSAAPACDGSSEIFPIPRQRNICTQEGYFIDPENCRWFYACKDYYGNGEFTVYEFRCPFGLAYDEANQKCNWPWLIASCDTQAKITEGRSRGKAIFDNTPILQLVNPNKFVKDCVNCDGAEIGITGKGVLHREKGIIVSPEYFENLSKSSLKNKNPNFSSKSQHTRQKNREHSISKDGNKFKSFNGGRDIHNEGHIRQQISNNKPKHNFKGFSNQRQHNKPLKSREFSNNKHSEIPRPVVINSAVEEDQFQKALFVTKSTDGPSSRFGSRGSISALHNDNVYTSSDVNEEEPFLRGKTTFGGHDKLPKLSLFSQTGLLGTTNHRNAFQPKGDNIRKINSQSTDTQKKQAHISRNHQKPIPKRHHMHSTGTISNQNKLFHQVDDVVKHPLHTSINVKTNVPKLKNSDRTSSNNQKFVTNQKFTHDRHSNINAKPIFRDITSNNQAIPDDTQIQHRSNSGSNLGHLTPQSEPFSNLNIFIDKKADDTISNPQGKSDVASNGGHFSKAFKHGHIGVSKNNFQSALDIQAPHIQKHNIKSGSPTTFKTSHQTGNVALKKGEQDKSQFGLSNESNFAKTNHRGSIQFRSPQGSFVNSHVSNVDGRITIPSKKLGNSLKLSDGKLAARKLGKVNSKVDDSINNRKTPSQFSDSSHRGKSKNDISNVRDIHILENSEFEGTSVGRVSIEPRFNQRFENQQSGKPFNSPKKVFSQNPGSFSQLPSNFNIGSNINKNLREHSLHQEDFRNDAFADIKEIDPFRHHIDSISTNIFQDAHNPHKFSFSSKNLHDFDDNKKEFASLHQSQHKKSSAIRPSTNFQSDHFPLNSHTFSPKTLSHFNDNKNNRFGNIPSISIPESGILEPNEKHNFKSIHLQKQNRNSDFKSIHSQKPKIEVHTSSHHQPHIDFGIHKNTNTRNHQSSHNTDGKINVKFAHFNEPSHITTNIKNKHLQTSFEQNSNTAEHNTGSINIPNTKTTHFHSIQTNPINEKANHNSHQGKLNTGNAHFNINPIGNTNTENGFHTSTLGKNANFQTHPISTNIKDKHSHNIAAGKTNIKNKHLHSSFKENSNTAEHHTGSIKIPNTKTSHFHSLQTNPIRAKGKHNTQGKLNTGNAHFNINPIGNTNPENGFHTSTLGKTTNFQAHPRVSSIKDKHIHNIAAGKANIKNKHLQSSFKQNSNTAEHHTGSIKIPNSKISHFHSIQTNPVHAKANHNTQGKINTGNAHFNINPIGNKNTENGFHTSTFAKTTNFQAHPRVSSIKHIHNVATGKANIKNKHLQSSFKQNANTAKHHTGSIKIPNTKTSHFHSLQTNPIRAKGKHNTHQGKLNTGNAHFNINPIGNTNIEDGFHRSTLGGTTNFQTHPRPTNINDKHIHNVAAGKTNIRNNIFHNEPTRKTSTENEHFNLSPLTNTNKGGKDFHNSHIRNTNTRTEGNIHNPATKSIGNNNVGFKNKHISKHFTLSDPKHHNEGFNKNKQQSFSNKQKTDFSTLPTSTKAVDAFSNNNRANKPADHHVTRPFATKHFGQSFSDITEKPFIGSSLRKDGLPVIGSDGFTGHHAKITSSNAGSSSFFDIPSHSLSSSRFSDKNKDSHGFKSHAPHSNEGFNQHKQTNHFTPSHIPTKINNRGSFTATKDKFKHNGNIPTNFKTVDSGRFSEENKNVNLEKNRNTNNIFPKRTMHSDSNPIKHFNLPTQTANTHFSSTPNKSSRNSFNQFKSDFNSKPGGTGAISRHGGIKLSIGNTHAQAGVKSSTHHNKPIGASTFGKSENGFSSLAGKGNLNSHNSGNEFTGTSLSRGFTSGGGSSFSQNNKQVFTPFKGKQLQHGSNNAGQSKSINGIGIRKPVFREPSLISKFRNNIPFQRHAPFGEKVYEDNLGPEVCERAGLFRHPESCDKFYECYWDKWVKEYTLHVFVCPVTIVYDSGITACNWPFDGPPCTDKNHP